MPRALPAEETATLLEQTLLFHAASGTLSGPQAEPLVRLLGLDGAQVRIVSLEWPSQDVAAFERFRESIRPRTGGFVGTWRSGHFSVLFPIDGNPTPWLELESDLPPAWRAGVGSVVPIARAGQSWAEAAWALEESEPGRWSLWAPRGTGAAEASFPFGLEKALLRALKAGDPDQAAFLTAPMLAALESLPGRLLDTVRQLVIVAAHQRGMDGALTDPLDELLAPFDSPEAAVPAVLKETLRQTLIRLARRRPASAELSPVVEKALEYVRENFHLAVSLEETARRVGVHPQYLSRVFSQERGESFVDFLTRLRVSKAKELLRSGRNVKATAAEVGYADANYFSRLFKKWEGLSPGDYAQGRRGAS